MGKRLGLSKNYVYMLENGRAPGRKVVEQMRLMESQPVDLPNGALVSHDDQARYVEESRQKGIETTQYHVAILADLMTHMRIVPPEHQAHVRAEIEYWLARYQEWCVANHSNEVAVSQSDTRKALAAEKKENGNGNQEV